MPWLSWGYNDVGETAKGYIGAPVGGTNPYDVPPAAPVAPWPENLLGFGAGWTAGLGFDDRGALWVWGLIGQGTPLVSFIGSDLAAAANPAGSGNADRAFKLTYAEAVNVIACGNTAAGVIWVRSDHTLWAVGNAAGDWGNGQGASGSANFVYHSTPINVTPTGANIIDVRTTDGATLALDDAGHVWFTGTNYSGQAGNGTTDASSTTTHPTWAQVPGLPFCTKFRADTVAVWAWCTDGNIYTWGGIRANNGLGGPLTGLASTDITTGPTALSPASFGGTLPVDICGLGDGFIPVGANPNFPFGPAYFLMPDGSLYVTGYNGNGELGIGNVTNQGAPVHSPLPLGVTVKRLPVIGSTPATIGLAGSDDKYYATGGNFSCQVDGVVFGPSYNTWQQRITFAGIVDKVYLMGDNAVFIGVTVPTAVTRRRFQQWV